MSQKIALADSFFAALQKLNANHQKAVLDAIGKLRKGYSSTHLHALNTNDWVSFNVNKDALRIICWRQSDDLLLAHVDKHDAAYKWAETHKSVSVGNAIRIRSFADDEVEDASRSSDKPAAGKVDERPPGPLATIRDKDFRHFEIAPAVADILRGVPDEDVLVDLLTHFRPFLGEAILMLATDGDDIGGILATYQAAKEQQQDDVKPDFEAPINSQNIWMPPPEHESLAEALGGDLEAWKLFLHPSQKKIVTKNTNGAMKVTGGPGTGKSVVALHRARHLAEHVFADDDRPILICTYSRVLANQLRADFDALCQDQPELQKRAVVKTINAVAKEILETDGEPVGLLFGQEIDECWDAAIKHDVLDYGRDFYEEEREFVTLPNRCTTAVEYRKAKRTGRPHRLNAASKMQVWKVISTFEEALRDRKGTDSTGLAALAATKVHAAGKSPYAAVICDEVQDASPGDLQLLGALATQDEDNSNRLLIVGDGHQRLYQRPVSLLACGIDVRGRSYRLKLNYRTTQGICAAALATVEGLSLDELDADENTKSGLDALRGYRSIRAGPAPERHSFDTAFAQADWIAEQIEGDGPLLVLARRNHEIEELDRLLQARGHRPVVLGDGTSEVDGATLALASLHRSKGLESPRVIIAHSEQVPLRWPGPKAGPKARWERQERSLLYVAMTRARDWLGMATVGAS